MKRMGWTTTAALMLLACAGWAASAFCTVAPGEVVVVRRLGRLVEPVWTAGIHVGWPWGLEHRDRVRLDEIRGMVVGPLADAGDAVEDSGEYLTGDDNLVAVRALVQYRVADPVAFVLGSIDPERQLAALAGAAVGRALAREPVDGVLRDRREPLAAGLRSRIEAGAATLGLGIEVVAVQLSEVRPPEEVAGEFSAAQSAASDRDRRKREAEETAARIAAESRAKAVRVTDTARAESSKREAAATAKAARFGTILTAFRSEPELTRRRLYLETLGTLFESVGRKLVIGPGEPVDLGLDAPR